MAIKKRVKMKMAKKLQEKSSDKLRVKRRLFAFSLLLVIVFALFANSLNNEFSKLDDYDYIITYGHFARPLNFSGLRQIFIEIPKAEFIHDYYRPLYILIRSIDYNIWKTNPLGYHLTNIIFFYLSCMVVYLIVNHLLESHWLALVTALLFAAHPVHTEAVSWVMSGGYPMSCAFLFFAFFSYLKTTASNNRKEFYRWLFLFIICYLAATLINPPAAILPVLVLFYDIFSRRKIFTRKIFIGYIGMGSVAFLMITLNYYIFPTEYIGIYADDFTAFLTLISNLGQYFFVMIFPFSLHTPHEYTVYFTTNLRFILSVFFLLGLLVYFVKGLRRKSWYAFGIGWFYIGLIPSITLWKNPASFGERYALYSSFGFSLITAMFIQNITKYFPKITITRKYISEAIVVLLLIFYSVLVIGRNSTWRNTETLMLDTLKKSPGNVYANKTLSDYYTIVRKTPEKAIHVLKSSIKIHENKLTQMVIPELRNAEQIYIAELRERLGNAYRESGQIDLAVKEHEESMKLVPQRNLPYFFLGLDYDSLADLWEKKGKPDLVRSNLEKALFYYEESFARSPKHSVAYFNGGLALFRLGRINECINMIKKGLAFSPYNFKALGILARAYTQNKEYKKAVILLRKSLKQAEERGEDAIIYELKRQLLHVNAVLGIEPDEKVQLPEGDVSLEDKFVFLFSQKNYAGALKVALEMKKREKRPNAKLINNIGLCHYKLNSYEEAKEYYQKSIELDPNYEVPYYNLSLIYVKSGQIEKAIEMCEKALSINPDYGLARSKLEFYKNVKKAINQVK